MADFESYPPEESRIDSTKPFEDDYTGYDPRLQSRRFDDSFRMSSEYADEHFPAVDESKDDGYDHMGDAPGYEPPSFEDGFNSEHGVHIDSRSPFDESFNSEQDFASRGDFSPVNDLSGQSFPASDEQNYGFMQQQSPVFGSGNGSVLPPPEEMEPEEGFLLREWKRENAIRLAEKERIEKERVAEIIEEAEHYKETFYSKRQAHCEAQKNNNREKEKVFLANQEHFHKTADKHYWKAVSELIPTEVPTIDTRRGKDKDKKKVTVIFNQGPKPGKPTDLNRMRQILLKLKHNPPDHMKTAPPPPPPAKADGEKKTEENKPEPAAAPAPAVEVAA